MNANACVICEKDYREGDHLACRQMIFALAIIQTPLPNH